MKQETINEINAYINDGTQPGGFLEAVLSNDLSEALYLADTENAASLREIVMYLGRNCPAGARGTRAQIRAWIRGNGLAGRRKMLV